MNQEDKLKVFEKELDYIINPKVKEFTEKAIQSLPDYFFSVPASSTGKYHPTYALGEGGLVRHVRAVIRIAVQLYNLEMFNHFTEYEKDLMLSALFLHDGAKSGIPQSNFTVAEHPTIVADYILNNPELNTILPIEDMELLLGGIRTHMGQWNLNFQKQEVLPKPRTKFQNFIHLADYLGSRKMLEMNFDVEVNR